MKEKMKNETLKRYEILFGQGLTTDAKDWVRDRKVLISRIYPARLNCGAYYSLSMRNRSIFLMWKRLNLRGM